MMHRVRRLGWGVSRGASRRVMMVAAAVALGLVAPASSMAQEVGLPLGTSAPAAAVEDLDGNAVDLLDYIQGRPAIIEFWATWCENCEILQPQMDRIHAEYVDQVSVVGVAVAVSQSVRRVKRHVEDHDPGYPVLWDADGAAVRAYLAPAASTVVILDADGKVVYTGTGPSQDLIAAVEAMLAGT